MAASQWGPTANQQKSPGELVQNPNPVRSEENIKRGWTIVQVTSKGQPGEMQSILFDSAEGHNGGNKHFGAAKFI